MPWPGEASSRSLSWHEGKAAWALSLGRPSLRWVLGLWGGLGGRLAPGTCWCLGVHRVRLARAAVLGEPHMPSEHDCTPGHLAAARTTLSARAGTEGSPLVHGSDLQMSEPAQAAPGGPRTARVLAGGSLGREDPGDTQ